MTQIGADLESANVQATGDTFSETEAYGRVRAQGDEATERASPASCRSCRSAERPSLRARRPSCIFLRGARAGPRQAEESLIFYHF